MSDTMLDLMEIYWSWMRERTSFQHVGDWFEITTPYLDRHNDYLRVYASITDSKIILSDDSYTINDLELSGFDLSSPKRRRILEAILNGFDVSIDGCALVVVTNPENFARKMHDLIQTMISVGDLSFASHTSERGVFQDIVGL